MDTRERQRAVEALTRAAEALNTMAIRLKRATVAVAAREGNLRISRRRSGVPWCAQRPSVQAARPRAKVPFRGEVARADARGRLRVRR